MRTACADCGWESTSGLPHQQQALTRAQQIGGYRARRHIKKAAKQDRNRAQWARLAALLRRRPPT